MASSLDRFQALIENSPDAISLVNEEGRVVYASASTAKVLGYQPEELLGQNGLDLLHPEDRDHSLRTLRKVGMEPLSHNRMQARVRQKDGHWLWVESTACNLLDEPSVGAIVMNYREIAARRADEEERQRVADELTHSNAELRGFAYTVAHDLREPLRTIEAFTEILVRRSELDHAQKEVADYIVDGVRRMSAMLDDLLSSVIAGSTVCGPVALEHAAALAMQNLRQAVTSSGATVVIDPLPEVQGNESELIRLFQNLISNALKFRTAAAINIHVTAERSKQNWLIKVRDNGIGIAKEHHRRIFGPFTRLHRSEIPGTGIGLATCEKIVERMGGTIWVESEPGAGSTFCFTVPTESQRTGRTAAAAAPGNGSTVAGRH
jgi:PAS domain S-box-containing protein